MDAGCGRHGCWYARDGFNGCFDDTNDGRCILEAAVSAESAWNAVASSPEGIDLSRCATITADSITADQLAGGAVFADGSFGGSLWPFEPVAGQPFEPVAGQPFEPVAGQPFEPVAGQPFDLVYRPFPGRGLLYAEGDGPPPPAEQGDGPCDGDMWHCPAGYWLFHCGSWRAVADLHVDFDDPGTDGLFFVPRSTVRLTGTWR